MASATLVIVLRFHQNSLETPTLAHTGPICIRFNFYMRGIVSNLYVFTSSRGEPNYVWNRHHSMYRHWHPATVSATISSGEKVGRVFDITPGRLEGRVDISLRCLPLLVGDAIAQGHPHTFYILTWYANCQVFSIVLKVVCEIYAIIL